MKNICIVPLIGIPGSGKSSLIKFIMQNKGDFPYYIIHIDYDNIVKLVQSNEQFVNTPYNEIRRYILKTVGCLIQLLQNKSVNTMNAIQKFILSKIEYDISENNVIIFIDDTMYYRSMRYDYFKICKTEGVSFYQLFLATDLDTALTRNSLRVGDSRIPPEIIKRMALRLELPNSKNLWEVNTLVIESNIALDKEILNQISSITNAMYLIPLENVIKPVLIVEQSLIHKVDLSLRKHIHKIIDQLPSKDKLNMKMVSSCLNEKRRQLLIDIRTGIIEIKEEHMQEFVESNMKSLNITIN